MLELNTISKNYTSIQALNPLSLKLETGKTHVFIGSSGSGKSTILRLIAGLTKCSSGNILFNGKTLDYKKN